MLLELIYAFYVLSRWEGRSDLKITKIIITSDFKFYDLDRRKTQKYPMGQNPPFLTTRKGDLWWENCLFVLYRLGTFFELNPEK